MLPNLIALFSFLGVLFTNIHFMYTIKMLLSKKKKKKNLVVFLLLLPLMYLYYAGPLYALYISLPPMSHPYFLHLYGLWFKSMLSTLSISGEMLLKLLKFINDWLK